MDNNMQAQALPVGYVRGDWDEDGYHVYPVVRWGRDWNGWARPHVTYETAQQLVLDQEIMLEGSSAVDRLEQDELWWETNSHGFPVLVHFRGAYRDEEGEHTTRITQAEDGTFDVSNDWCWVEANVDGSWKF